MDTTFFLIFFLIKGCALPPSLLSQYRVVVVSKSCLILCNPIDRSILGFHIFHCPPEVAHIYVH